MQTSVPDKVAQKLSPMNMNNSNSQYVLEEDKVSELEQQMRRRSRKSEEKQS